MRSVYRTQPAGEEGELTIMHRGEIFVLVPGAAIASYHGYELMTEDYVPVRYAYPRNPKTGVPYSVGNIDYLRPSYHRAGGRLSEGWGAPQLRAKACPTPQKAAEKLLSWLDRKARSANAGSANAGSANAGSANAGSANAGSAGAA